MSDVVQIPLSRGLVAVIDAAEEVSVRRYTWSAKVQSHSCYAVRTVWVPGQRHRMQSLHTFLTGWTRVDHINGDGLDNRMANLRPVTNQQNQFNRRKRTAASSRYKGVHWSTRSARWIARIKLDGRHIQLGTTTNEIEAALAYDEAARRYFGHFAALNFPRPGECGAIPDQGWPSGGEDQ